VKKHRVGTFWWLFVVFDYTWQNESSLQAPKGMKVNDHVWAGWSVLGFERKGWGDEATRWWACGEKNSRGGAKK